MPQVTHSVTRHNDLAEDGLITVTDHDMFIQAVYRVRGGKGQGYEVLENTTKLTEEETEAVLDRIGSTGLGEWEASWTDLGA